MSVTDISQKFEKKKNLHFLSNHFQMYHSFIISPPPPHHSLIHLSDPLSPASEECSTLLILVNNNNEKRKKKQQRFHTSVQNKKAAFALVRLPQQGNKHSYNLLRSKAIDRSRPCVGSPAPRPTGTRQPRKSLCSPKSTSYMFYRENRRGICLLVKFTIQSSESVRMTRQLG